MPVMTFGGQTEENRPAAVQLLQQGDASLEDGDSRAAITSYIQAADLVPSIPAEYALKAARLLIDDTSIKPRFEAARIAGCLLSSAYDGERSDRLLTNVFRFFETFLSLWRRANLAPLQHLVMLGEGGMVSLLQPVWNEGGHIEEKLLHRSANPAGLETSIRKFAAQGIIFAVSIDTLYGWRPFMIPPPIRDDADLWNWMRFNGLFGVQYISPSFLPTLNRVRENNGRPAISIKEEFDLPASMTWYENFGFDFKNYCLDGMHRPEGRTETTGEAS